jgi:hypothetical protein
MIEEGASSTLLPFENSVSVSKEFILQIIVFQVEIDPLLQIGLF